MHAYQLANISFSYALGSQQVEALRGISLDIPSRSLVTISGPSGSGKSTLLNLLGLIEPMQKGQLLFQGEKIAAMSASQLNAIRKFKIGFIFQQFHLIPMLTAEENVAYFLRRQGMARCEIHERTRQALEAVSLSEHRMKRPSQMSGGQKQRVAIARALAKMPKVIIGDETTASLDSATGREMMEIFRGLVDRQGITVILTTHDKMVLTYADLNFLIQDGRLA